MIALSHMVPPPDHNQPIRASSLREDHTSVDPVAGRAFPRRRARLDAPTGSSMGLGLLELSALNVAVMAPWRTKTQR